MNKNLKSSPLRVYSIYTNVKKVLKRKKYKDENLYKMVWFKGYNDAKWIHNDCKRIFNDIENSFYSYNDLLIAMFYESIFIKSFTLRMLTDKRINEIKSLFSLIELKKDKKILLAINKNIIFNSIEDYFRLNTEEVSYIYELIMKKFISPIFWIKYDNFFDSIEQIYKESEEHIKFRKICKYMKSHY